VPAGVQPRCCVDAHATESLTHTGCQSKRVLSWATCLAIIGVATTGKLGGTVLAARWTGLSWRDSVALGALMNTRGLMELIALNVGYDPGILTPEIFAMMVLMALVTTTMTGPLLSLSLHWGRDRLLAPDSTLSTPRECEPFACGTREPIAHRSIRAYERKLFCV
jgi:Sodium/hydrogen exchanger family